MSLHLSSPTESQGMNGAVPGGKAPLGYVNWDGSTACNDRIIMRSPLVNRNRIIRDQYVRIEDPLGSRTDAPSTKITQERKPPSRRDSLALWTGLDSIDQVSARARPASDQAIETLAPVQERHERDGKWSAGGAPPRRMSGSSPRICESA